jgi:hypothetical protein
LTSGSPVCPSPFSWSSVAGFLTPFFPKLIALALYTIPAGTALSHLQIIKAQALLSRNTPYPQTRTGRFGHYQHRVSIEHYAACVDCHPSVGNPTSKSAGGLSVDDPETLRLIRASRL